MAMMRRSFAQLSKLNLLVLLYSGVSITGVLCQVESPSLKEQNQNLLRDKRSLQLARLIPNIDLDVQESYRPGRGFPKHTVEIVQLVGYPIETYMVETEDGYILEVHRIPPKGPTGNKLPVLLAHGNFQSSAEWVINTPTNLSLAFILSDEGYDVWMANFRGNNFSKLHKKYNVSTSQFWDFGFHEMGIYDMPAMIDYILDATNKPKLHYITLSMGPTVYLAGISYKPEYTAKLASVVLMGPTVYMANFYSGLTRLLSGFRFVINMLLKLYGSLPLLPHFYGDFVHSIMPIYCNPRIDVFGICASTIQRIYGDDGNLMTPEQTAQVFATTPSSGSSLKLGNHVLQLWSQGRFVEYDYGPMKNMQVYGRLSPPDYDISKATAPTAVFAGLGDIMANIKDVRTLVQKLPNVVDYYESPYKKFCHLNFVYGREPAAHLYYRAIDFMKKFE